MYETAMTMRFEDKKFFAALKGVDLDEQSGGSDFDEVVRRAEAKAAGISEEAYELDGMFDIIDEEEV